MVDVIRIVLELSVIVPGLVLSYLPFNSCIKKEGNKLKIFHVLTIVGLIALSTFIAYSFRIPTSYLAFLSSIILFVFYSKTISQPLLKKVSVALSVVALFALLKSLVRSINILFINDEYYEESQVWLTLLSAIIYNLVCLFFLLISHKVVKERVSQLIEDENFAETWYVFWVLPLVFIILNLFTTPRYTSTLLVGRVKVGYLALNISLLLLLLLFYVLFFFMASNLNKNAKLEKEKKLLSIERNRYEELEHSIEEAKGASHDMRHHLMYVYELLERDKLKEAKEYLSKAVKRIPNVEKTFCSNMQIDSVIGYYYGLMKSEGVSLVTEINIPKELIIDETDVSLILSNLLEYALAKTKDIGESKKEVELTLYMPSKSVLLIQTKNTINDDFDLKFDKDNDIALESVKRLAEKNNGAFSYACINSEFASSVTLKAK